jgi:hypothetical protein
MSFAFTVDGADGQSWNTSNEDACPNRRTIRRATLVDVSPVASPAYDKGTSVNARRLDYGAIVSDQSAIHAQIAVWNQRKKNLFIEARAIAALFPGIALEDVALYSRIYKGTELQDRLYQLRAWDLGKEMWQGGAFGVQCGEGLGATHREGQTSDPQMTLRDCTEADSKLSHRQAAKFHRTAAQKASDFSDGAKHYVAGDAHAEAARMYPDKDASERARAASRGLR